MSPLDCIKSSERSLGSSDPSARGVTVAFWIVALVLGGLRMWSTRYAMDPDSISYLDMGDAYLRRDWRMALNGTWNPLYAWLLILSKLVVKPGQYWEFPFLHLVNFAVYVGGLACVHFLLVELARRNRRLDASPRWQGTLSVPPWALFALGYALYIWSSLDLIDFREGADLCLAAMAYLAFGMLLRCDNRPSGWGSYILLAVALGFGYLTKAVMFPLGFVFRQRRSSSLANDVPFSLASSPRLSFLAFLSLPSSWRCRDRGGGSLSETPGNSTTLSP